MGRHEGGEPEAGLDHPADEGMRAGRGLPGGEGYGALDRMFLGQAAEAEDGELEGHPPAEGIDTMSEGVHMAGVTSLRLS